MDTVHLSHFLRRQISHDHLFIIHSAELLVFNDKNTNSLGLTNFKRKETHAAKKLNMKLRYSLGNMLRMLLSVVFLKPSSNTNGNSCLSRSNFIIEF